MSLTGWDHFWKEQRQSFYAVMQIATNYFASQFEKQLNLKPSDAIFDYGCGPGFLADALAAKNFTGADINAFFIEECRKNHPAATFFQITTDITENTKILQQQLNTCQFDFIVLLSIVQYFKNTSELESLVKLLHGYLKENGRIIISDVIDDKTSSVRDAVALFFHCLKKGKIGAFAGFIGYLLFSNYRKISKETSLLNIPESVIRAIAQNSQLHYQQVSGLTLHPTRKNYVLSKNQFS